MIKKDLVVAQTQEELSMIIEKHFLQKSMKGKDVFTISYLKISYIR